MFAPGYPSLKHVTENVCSRFFRDFGMMHLAGDLFQIYDALIISFFRQGESKSEVCYFLEVGIRGAASDFG
jgi:hypothetical protein